MEAFKVENFEREHGKNSFPAYWQMKGQALHEMQRRLSSALSIDEAFSRQEICQALETKSQLVEGVNAEDNSFDLRSLLDQFGIVMSDEVCINWYHFEALDVMRASDFVRHFSDIWYPSSDDIDIFDQSVSWVLSISHYGSVKMARISG